jgi:hypothetical protein
MNLNDEKKPLPPAPVVNVGLPPGYEHLFAAAPVAEEESPAVIAHQPAISLISRWRSAWRNLGGSSLSFSLLIHLGLALVAGSVVYVTQLEEPEKVDFLPSNGGSDNSSLISEKVRTKRTARMLQQRPSQRIAVVGGDPSFTLPEITTIADGMPNIEQQLGSGSLGKGISMNKGIGFGSGLGKLNGVTFKPLMLFDFELKDARKIAVVMDVSRSMTKHLPAVVRELDKIANHSVLVLYFGCGISAFKDKKDKINDRVYQTKGEDFQTFWQVWQGTTELAELNRLRHNEQWKKLYDPQQPMPLVEIYQKVANRPNTYFVEFNGTKYAWLALLSKEVMDTDTIYWFADFADLIEETQAAELCKKLKGRKQKLYLHAAKKGGYLQQAKEWLVEPLGGQVVETKPSTDL